MRLSIAVLSFPDTELDKAVGWDFQTGFVGQDFSLSTLVGQSQVTKQHRQNAVARISASLCDGGRRLRADPRPCLLRQPPAR